MRKAKWIAIIAAIICMIGGTVAAVLAMVMMKFDFSSLNTSKVSSKTYEVEEPFKNLNLQATECNVRILPSQDGVSKVICMDSDSITHSVAVEADTLYVTREDNRKWYEHIGFFWDEMGITVYLPEKELEQLYIKSVSGDIIISENMSFESAEIYNTSGDITFSGNVKKKLKVKTVSGELYVKKLTEGDLDVQTTSGDITLAELTVDNLEADTTSGEIELYDVLVKNDIQMESASGDVEFRDIDGENLWIKTISGEVEGTLRSGKMFRVCTTSGEVQIPNSSAEGGNCEIITTSGDIEIRVKDDLRFLSKMG